MKYSLIALRHAAFLAALLLCAVFCHAQVKYSQEWLKVKQYWLLPYDACISTNIFYLHNDTTKMLLNKKDTIIRVDSVFAIKQVWQKSDSTLDSAITESDFQEQADTFFKERGGKFYKYRIKDKDDLEVLATSFGMNPNKETILKHPEKLRLSY